MHIAGLQAFNNSELLDFYENDLQKVCPFYEPNGVRYRECIVGLIQKERYRLAKNPIIIETTEKYCNEGVAKTMEEGSLGFTDVYNTCTLYMLKTI